MIYQEIGLIDFMKAFETAGRGNMFSPLGYVELYRVLSETGMDVELDVSEICCTWCECSVDTALKVAGCTTLGELSEQLDFIRVDDDTILCATL